MSRMQIPYEYFGQGLAADASNLTPLGIASFFPGQAVPQADYGFIAYHPASPLRPTSNSESLVIFADNEWNLEIILGRDRRVDHLAPIEERMMTLFHGRQFVSTTSGQVESSNWRGSFDLPFDPVDGTYPRRIMTFEIVVH